MMTRHISRFVLAALLAGCGAIHSHPLTPPAGGARTVFEPLVACARAKAYQVSDHGDSVNVEIEASTWVQFMDQDSGFNMVIVGASDDIVAQRAKSEGDALYACAQEKLAAATPPAGAATSPVGGETPPAGTETPTAGTATPPAGAPKPGGGMLGGLGDALGGAANDIGKGLSAAGECTRETQCFTSIGLTVCKALVDDKCRDELSRAHQKAGPDGESCRRAIGEMMKVAVKYSGSIAGWTQPASCAL